MQNKWGEKHLSIHFDSSSSSSNNICLCLLSSIWFVVETSSVPFKPFNSLSVQVSISIQSLKDFVEKAIKDFQYAPLNRKAGVKCSYVYILLKENI